MEKKDTMKKLRWWNHIGTIIRKDLKVLRGELPVFFGLLILFPLSLGFFYGLMYQNIIDQNVELRDLSLYIIKESNDSDTDNMIMEGWTQALQTGVFPFLNVVELPSRNSWEDLLKEEQSVGLVISPDRVQWVNLGEDSMEKEIIRQFVHQAIRETNLAVQFQHQLSMIQESGDAEHYSAFVERSKEVDATRFVQELPHMHINALSSRQFFMISVFIAFSLFFSTGIVLQREKKLVRRAYATGLSKTTLYLGNALTTFSISFVMMTVYFILVFGAILQVNVPFIPLLGVVAMQAIMVTGFQSMLMGLCRSDKTGTLISIIVLMIFLFLGGGNYPTDTVAGAQAISNVIPNYNVFKLYEALVLDIPLSSMLGRFGLVGAVSAIMGMVGWIVFRKKEEV